MQNVLREHLTRYPKMEICDIVKLIFQSEFGGGHLIKDELDCRTRLEEEYKNTRQNQTPLFENIGGGLYRLNLGSAKSTSIKAATIASFFILSSSNRQGSVEGFEQKLEELKPLCDEGLISREQLEDYLAAYRQELYPAVSHSKIYKEQYKPSYRIVNSEFKNFFEVFCLIDSLEDKNNIIAIEGNSGSSKTTLARLLENVYDCNVFHTDDFFLQPHQRTPQRLEEVGGNLDYERLESEVLHKLITQQAFSYRVFDCSVGELTKTIDVRPKPLNIVEGVYSMHPSFVKHYDATVFLYTDKATQHRRILARSGEAMLEMFKENWIPLEDKYFNQLCVKSRSSLQLDTSHLF